MSRVLQLLHSRALIALVFQGINGLVQVEAFFSLSGDVYLAFSSAYLLGTVLALLLVLNFENVVLAGRWSVAVRRYAVAIWCAGLAAASVAVLTRAAVPSFMVFCCFAVSLRMFLAWANHARLAPASLGAAAMLVLASCLAGDVSHVALAAMLAFPLAAWRADGPRLHADDGLSLVARDSFLSFVKYLPHTLSGLFLGYADRYVALNVVGGGGAETYLRTLQVGSWASFVAYPIVFHARNRVLQAGTLEVGAALRTVGLLAASIVPAAALILAIGHFHKGMQVLSPWLVVMVLLAIVCSQSYQVVSSLNFVKGRFSAINRITLISTAVVLLLAFGLVPFWKTAEALAVVLLSGWCVQFGLTVSFLRHQRG